jgi:hypothetical protein
MYLNEPMRVVGRKKKAPTKAEVAAEADSFEAFFAVASGGA